jgi:photosystem II stability/assembly factor-like uncharacterized protein
MSVVAPPERPRADELEALIPEARSRQRRRWLVGAAALALAASLGLSLWPASPGGGTVVVRGHGPIQVVAGHVTGSPAALRRGIGDVGSGGGVTWAINGHGIWLTTNGGRTWRRSVPRDVAAAKIAVASPPEIQFVNKRVGWMSAPLAFDRQELSKGVIHWEVDWTTDGGRTWHRSIPPGCLRVCDDGSISFLDARHGYAFASVVGNAQTPNKLFRTSDGGRTWQRVSQPPIWGPITFVDEKDGFAGGPGELIEGLYLGPRIVTLYRTTDGGRSWSKFDPAGSGSFTEQPYTAAGRDVLVPENGPNRNGGLNLVAGAVYASRDAGRNWIGRAVPFAPTSAVSFSAASPSVWAWSSRQAVYLSNRAGKGWREIALRGLPPRAWITKIDFTSSLVGWAIFSGFGTHTNLFRTVDGGVHWTPAGPRVRRHHTRG